MREQMEWEGKGGLLKTSFQKTPVTASGSFFQPFLWEGFFHKSTESPLSSERTDAFWVVVWECRRGWWQCCWWWSYGNKSRRASRSWVWCRRWDWSACLLPGGEPRKCVPSWKHRGTCAALTPFQFIWS